MKTKLDVLLEKWRSELVEKERKNIPLNPFGNERMLANIETELAVSKQFIAELTAVKDYQNDPVDDMHQVGQEVAAEMMFKDSVKPSPSKDKRLWLTEQEKFLEAWMQEVKGTLARQIEIPNTNKHD